MSNAFKTPVDAFRATKMASSPKTSTTAMPEADHSRICLSLIGQKLLIIIFYSNTALTVVNIYITNNKLSFS